MILSWADSCRNIRGLGSLSQDLVDGKRKAQQAKLAAAEDSNEAILSMCTTQQSSLTYIRCNIIRTIKDNIIILLGRQ